MKKFNTHLIIILCSVTTLPCKAMELKRRRPQKKEKLPLQIVTHTNYNDDEKAHILYIMQKSKKRNISKERKNAIKRFEQRMCKINTILDDFDTEPIDYPSYLFDQESDGRQEKYAQLYKLLLTRRNFEQAIRAKEQLISKSDAEHAEKQLDKVAYDIDAQLQKNKYSFLG